ncbi:MAG: DUF58 domain-containing protein [Lachnospiraceae bacterium]|nr:DUF58 domain-containing protein [Lachnospiraceae bacterium]
MKNKRVLIPIALLILALVGISFYGGPVTYVFFWTVVLLPVICLIYIFLVIRNIKIYQRTEGRDMVCGTPAPFYITLQNEGFFSFASLRIIFYSSFSTISEIDDDVEYELPPHSSIQRTTKILCKYRGEYFVGIKKIVVKDFLGLFSVTYTIKEPLNVIVSPAIIHLPKGSDRELILDADRDNQMKKPVPDIPVREYVQGDDIRFLNWKASAVMQKLMVRERRGEEKSGIAIIMDPGRYGERTEEYLPPENKVIEQVLAMTLYNAENNIPTDVFYRTTTPVRQSVRSTGDFDALYQVMRRYIFRDDTDMKHFLGELYDEAYLSEYRMLVFVLQKWSEEEAEWVKNINTDQMPVRVYLISEEEGEEFTDASDNKTEILPIGRKSYTEVTS